MEFLIYTFIIPLLGGFVKMFEIFLEKRCAKTEGFVLPLLLNMTVQDTFRVKMAR